MKPKTHETKGAAAVACTDLLGRTNEFKLEDFIRWRRNQDQHDQIGNVLTSQASGTNCGNVKEPPQVLAQLLAFWRKVKPSNPRPIIIKAGAHKSPLNQKVAQAFKLIFKWIGFHKETTRPNEPAQASRAHGMRHATKASSRRCLQQAGWAHQCS
jgi:hypothetical protein